MYLTAARVVQKRAAKNKKKLKNLIFPIPLHKSDMIWVNCKSFHFQIYLPIISKSKQYSIVNYTCQSNNTICYLGLM